jgi:hypothetical protein
MYKASLLFNENFLEFDVYVDGFGSELEANFFANSMYSCLYLQRTELELVVNEIRLPILRKNVIVRIDRQWHTRTPLDPNNPDAIAKIKQSMIDYEQGIDNPLNVKEEDLEIIDLSFGELLDMLNDACSGINKKERKITECIAYGVHLSSNPG